MDVYIVFWSVEESSLIYIDRACDSEELARSRVKECKKQKVPGAKVWVEKVSVQTQNGGG